MANDKQKCLLIDRVCDFFMNYISKCDLTPYFEIHISTDIVKDCIAIDTSIDFELTNNYAGMTILPYNSAEKIQILISDKNCTPDNIIHELMHMYDIILFSRHFCENKLYEVRNHKYYLTFIYWSEFHVKQVEIPYMFVFLSIINETTVDKELLDFKKNIKGFYYPKYNQKLIKKDKPAVRDIMWYLGELYVCKVYDSDNEYYISQEVLEVFGYKISELYDIVMRCLDFDGYIDNAEELYAYFQ